MQFSSRSFVPASKQMLAVIACTFAVGIGTLVTVTILALLGLAILLAYALQLAFSVLHELSLTIATLYTSSDSAIRLLIIVLICWGVLQLARPLVRSIKASWR
jgi:hypothetical protein